MSTLPIDSDYIIDSDCNSVINGTVIDSNTVINSASTSVNSNSSVIGSNVISDTVIDSSSGNNGIDVSIENKLLCMDCGVKFVSRNALFRHIRVTHSNTNTVINTNTCIATANTNTCSVNGTISCDAGDTDEGGINGSGNVNKRLRPNDIIASSSSSASSPDLIIKTAQEDDWYRVIIKPQGLSTMGLPGSETLMNSPQLLLPNAIRDQLRYKKAIPCHRLDRATGGLMVCSKSKLAECRLKNSFRYHTVYKRYRAIVMGTLDNCEGVIDMPLSDVSAVTKYQVVKVTSSIKYGSVSTVDLWPITGRKHQLRKHMQMIGHPIIGDPRYSSALSWPEPPFDYLFLWALEINFPHPFYEEAGPTPDNHVIVDVTDATDAMEEKKRITVDADSLRAATVVARIHEQEIVGNDVVARDNCNTSVMSYPVRVRVSIDEPAYYEEFRKNQQDAFDAQHAAVI